MDWRNPKNDRAKAVVDNFKSLDGRFDSNVILQIKNGPRLPIATRELSWITWRSRRSATGLPERSARETLG